MQRHPLNPSNFTDGDTKQRAGSQWGARGGPTARALQAGQEPGPGGVTLMSAHTCPRLCQPGGVTGEGHVLTGCVTLGALGFIFSSVQGRGGVGGPGSSKHPLLPTGSARC